MGEALKEFFLEWWPWIKEESNNRGVMLIVVAASVFIALMTLIIQIWKKRNGTAACRNKMSRLCWKNEFGS